MQGLECQGEGTGLCPGCGEPWKGCQAGEKQDRTRPRAAMRWVPAGLETREQSGRPGAALPGSSLPPTVPKGDSPVHWGPGSGSAHTMRDQPACTRRLGAEPTPPTVLPCRVRVCHLVPGPQQRVHHPASERDHTRHPPLAEPHPGGGK